MTENQEEQPTSLFIDPVWFGYRELINNVAGQISGPKTLEGENISKEALLKSPVIQAYPRLREVLDSLISLIEFDEIGRYTNKDFFSNSMSGEIVIRAFMMRLEDIVKDPYSPEEGKKYDDYKLFFEGLLRKLKNLDNKEKEDGSHSNFIDDLVLLTAQEINKLRGVANFRINTDIIRARIREYLEKLSQSDEGKQLLSVITEKIEELASLPKPNYN